jgi:hypothetical protein
MVDELEAELRPLVDAVRAAVERHVCTGGPLEEPRWQANDSASFAAAVRLADTWAVAGAVGVPRDRLRARFGPDDLYLIDLVAAVHTAALVPSPDGWDDSLPELARLLAAPATG